MLGIRAAGFTLILVTAMMNHTRSIAVRCHRALIVIALLAAGCAHSGKSAGESATDARERSDPARSGTEISSEDINRTGDSSVEQILEGRAAGVSVIQTPGGYQLRIRGSGTFSGSNEPLIVIDGKALPDRYSGSIPVNPHDIESIRVLKNAIDLAFYGMRGANGVILITTKRGE